MSEGSGQVPADWYPDPHAPQRMRYFDGVAWTDHIHIPGRMPDVGQWLNATFTVFAKHWLGALVLALGTALVGAVVFWLPLRWVFAEVAFVDNSLVGLGATQVAVGAVAVVAAQLVQAFGSLALNRFMQRAHYDVEPTVSEALRHGLARLPRFVLVALGLVAASLVIFAIVSVVFVLAPALGVLLLIALFPLAVWAYVKLAFIYAAAVAAPKDASIINSSVGVSRERFWGVLGRVLLVVIGLIIIQTIVSPLAGAPGQTFDADLLVSSITVEGDNAIVIADLAISEVLPSAAVLFFAIGSAAIVQSLSRLVSTSAFMRLYLDSGAPSESFPEAG